MREKIRSDVIHKDTYIFKSLCIWLDAQKIRWNINLLG